MTDKLRRLRNWLLTAGLAFLTVGSALFVFQEQVKKRFPTAAESYVEWLPTIGLALCAVGLLLCAGILLCLLLSAFVVPAKMAGASVARHFGSHDYDCRVAKKRDIDWLHQFGEQQLRVTADINMLRDWHSVNYEIFWVIINKRARGDRFKKLAGYFAIIPLNKLGTDLVEAEKLDGGSFTRDHIIAHKRGRIRKTPTSIYIGGVAARRGLRLRQFTLDSLKAHIGKENSNGVKTFFTRPVTKDGLRLVKRHQFVPVNKFVKGFVKEHIYKFSYDDDED